MARQRWIVVLVAVVVLLAVVVLVGGEREERRPDPIQGPHAAPVGAVDVGPEDPPLSDPVPMGNGLDRTAHREAVELLQPPARQGLTDARPDAPYRIELRDEGREAWLDLDRDGQWDERLTRRGDRIVREVATGDGFEQREVWGLEERAVEGR